MPNQQYQQHTFSFIVAIKTVQGAITAFILRVAATSKTGRVTLSQVASVLLGYKIIEYNKSVKNVE